MNKIFKVIWSKTSQTWVAVSELSKNKSRSSTSNIKLEKHSVSNLLKTSVSLISLTLFSQYAGAYVAITSVENGKVTTDSTTLATPSSNAGLTWPYNYYNPGNKSYENKAQSNSYHLGYSFVIEGDDNNPRSKTATGIAIGKHTDVRSVNGSSNGVAIGDYAQAKGGLATSIGAYAQAEHTGSTAIGTAARASGFNSLAMMRQSAANGNYSAAIGSVAWAEGDASFAFGASATAKGIQSIAIGNVAPRTLAGIRGKEINRTKYDGLNNTQTNGDRSVAIGSAAKTNGNDSFAFGSKAKTGEFELRNDTYLNEQISSPINNKKADKAIAFGTDSHAKGTSSVAFGFNSIGAEQNSIGFGVDAKALKTNAIAFGTSANASAMNAVAFGNNAKALHDNVVTIGYQSEATKAGAMAIGEGAKSYANNSLALGKGTIVNTSDIGTNNSRYTNERFDVERGVVAIANKGSERRLVNLAAGSNDTDAVNVKQLVDVNDNLAHSIAGNTYNGYAADGHTYKAPDFNIKNQTLHNVKSAVELAQTNYVSVKATRPQTDADSNYDNLGAKGDNSIAIGEKAKTSLVSNYSVAVGVDASVNSRHTTAIGGKAKAEGINGVAIGYGANATTDNPEWGPSKAINTIDQVAVGSNASAAGDRGTAIGANTKAFGAYALALGENASSKSLRGMALGNNATVEKLEDYTLVYSNPSITDPNATETRQITESGDPNRKEVGKGEGSGLAVGAEAFVGRNAAHGIALGGNSRSVAHHAMAIGPWAEALSSYSLALGNNAITRGRESIAIGIQAQTTENAVRAIALGWQAQPQTRDSIAIGTDAHVDGNDATDSIVIGSSANSHAQSGVAIGRMADVSAASGVALGEGSQAYRNTLSPLSRAYDVVDDDSRSRRYVGMTTSGGDAPTYGAVSVGSAKDGDIPGAFRQIINLAAGNDDNDAVNVAQLKNVGVKVAGDEGKSDFLVHKGALKIKGKADSRISTAAKNDGDEDSLIEVGLDLSNLINNGENTYVTGDGSKANPYKVHLNTTITNLTSATFGADNDKTVMNKDGITITNGDNTISLTENGLNNGDKKITNVANGEVSENSKDAVNGSQLYATNEKIKAATTTVDKGLNFKGDDNTPLNRKMGDTLIVKGGVTEANKLSDDNIGVVGNATDGSLTVKLAKSLKGLESVETKQIKLGDANSNTTITYGDNHIKFGDKTLAGLDDERHIAPSTFTVDDTGTVNLTYVNGKGEAVSDTTAKITGVAKSDLTNLTDAGKKNVTALGTVVKKGDNITIKEETDEVSGRKTYTINAVVPGSDAFNLKYRANGENEKTISLTEGLNFKGGDYITAGVEDNGVVKYTLTTGGITNQDGTPRKGTDGLATVETVVNAIKDSGWKATALANGGALDGTASPRLVKTGNEVAFAAGKNLVVKQDVDGDNQKYTYSLNSTLADLTSATFGTGNDKTVINKDGITITEGDRTVSLTEEGLNNGDKKITNVANGEVSENSKEAVNGSQLYATNEKIKAATTTVDKGLNFKGDDNTPLNRKMGDTLIVKGGVTEANKLSDDNIGVVGNAEDGSLTVKLAKSLKGLESVETKQIKLGDANSNTTITYGDNHIKFGDKTLAGLDDERHIAPSTFTVDETGTVNLTYVNGKGEAVTDTAAKITGVAKSDLTNLTDAGKKNVTALGTVVKKGNNITIDEETDDVTGRKTYTINANNLKYQVEGTSKTTALADGLTFKGGDYITASVEDNGVVKYTLTTGSITNQDGTPRKGTDGLATVETVVNAIKDSGWKATALDNGGKLDGTAVSTLVKTGNEVAFAAGKNLVVKQDITGDNQKYTYSLDPNLTNLDKLVVNGKDGANGKEGVTITGPQGSTGQDGQNGKVGISGADGKDAVSIAGKDGVGHIGLTGAKGADGQSSVDITTDKGKKFLESSSEKDDRLKYTDSKQAAHEIATMDDGLKFKGNKGDTIVKKLNETLDIIGNASDAAPVTDRNLRVDSENNKLVLKMAKQLQDLTSATFIEAGGNRAVINGNGLTITPNQAVEKTVSLTNNGLNNGGNQIVNVDSGLKVGDKTVSLKEATGDTLKNVVNVDDLKTSIEKITDPNQGGGFGLTDEKGNKVTAALGDTVTVKGDDSVVTNVVTEDGKTKFKIGLNKDITVGDATKAGTILVKGENGKDGVAINGKDGSIGLKGADGENGITLNGKEGSIGIKGKDGSQSVITTKQGQAGLDGNDGTNGKIRLVYTKADKTTEEVATMNDGLKFVGNDGKEVIRKLNTALAIQGGLDKDTVVDNTKVSSANIGVRQKGEGGLEIVMKERPAFSGVVINGKDGKDAEVKFGVDGQDGMSIAGKKGENGIEGLTIRGQNGKDGVTFTQDGRITNVKDGQNDNDVINKSQLDKGVAKATTKVSAGKNMDVVPTNNEDGSTTYIVKTKENVAFTTVMTGNTTMDNEGITIRESAGGKTHVKLSKEGLDNGGNKIVNVAPGEVSETSTDAVNGAQLHKTEQTLVNKGLDFGTQSGVVIHKKLGEKLDIVGGGQKSDSEYSAENVKTITTKEGKILVALDKHLKSDTIIVGKSGKDGKPGVDGKIGVNGKDGSSVVINGKEGSIGLTGPKGADGTTPSITLKTEKGSTTVNEKDSGKQVERVKYTDGKNTREVATLDDGLKFKGDDNKVINRALGSQLNIQGGAKDATAEDNIQVVSQHHNTLKVKLANNIRLNDNGSMKVGQTTVNKNGVTIGSGNKQVSVTEEGLNNGGNRITNVSAGRNNTDAVNFAQLKNVANHFDNRLDDMNKRRTASTASALASAGLMQAHRSGQSAVTVALGQYQSQSAIAVGYSRLSDNGKYGIKIAFTTNTQNENGGSVGAGYFW